MTMMSRSKLYKTKLGWMLPLQYAGRTDVKAGDVIYCEQNHYSVKGMTYSGGNCLLILDPCK